ncbi:ABC transporter ATP-binding protein [Verticiella sediminum]|uniref:ABC transporter ATP-binding protein n=2 Tax=Verticiella sediminum TaxID=1247510 RepID=A0A556A5Z2_9BURK|nr:ABC transporter ATP-binding protein [Verticiella sediminum]
MPNAAALAAQPGTANAVVSLRNVHAGYGGGAVLRGVDLELKAGDVLAVLGRNGAGKTTLLNALFNLGPDVHGDILVHGRRVNGWPTHRIARAGLALVPQGRGVFASLAVQENLRLATLTPRSRRLWSLDDVYALFPRLHERRNAASGMLSGGERQMLAVGRALLTQAEVIALDEPSEGLAPMLVQSVLAPALRTLAERGTTLLLVEQNLGLALDVATHTVVLAQGRVAYAGAPERLRRDHDAVHRLLGI